LAGIFVNKFRETIVMCDKNWENF